jgi:hypothetical protein
MTDYERGYEQGKTDAAKKMHLELRDYFAAGALQALIEIYEPDGVPGCVSSCARDAYRYADAMLEARKDEVRNP